MRNRNKCKNKYDEIDRFDSGSLELLYQRALEVFLSIEDIKRFKITFTSTAPEHKSPIVDFRIDECCPKFKSEDNKFMLLSFSCNLQSFPGCCGYLVMSNMIFRSFSDRLKPFIKGIFELARILNYQTLFTSHISRSQCFSLLEEMFKEIHITGPNVRTGNKLAYFVQPVEKILPVQIYKIFENPKASLKSVVNERIILDSCN